MTDHIETLQRAADEAMSAVGDRRAGRGIREKWLRANYSDKELQAIFGARDEWLEIKRKRRVAMSTPSPAAPIRLPNSAEDAATMVATLEAEQRAIVSEIEARKTTLRALEQQRNAIVATVKVLQMPTAERQAIAQVLKAQGIDTIGRVGTPGT